MRIVANKLNIKDFTYIADSAAVTADNLDAIYDCKANFILLIPSTYNIEKNLKESAYQNKDRWTEIGKISNTQNAAEYKIQSFIDEINGRKYRFLVCHSDQLDKRKLKSLTLNISKEKTQLKKLIKKMEKNDYYCKDDALAEVNRFIEENKLKYHLLDTKFIIEERNKKRSKVGKPKADEIIEKETWYKVKFEIYENDRQIEKLKSELGMVVLITNILDKSILSEIIPGKVKTHTPTGKNILELLENIIVSIITFEDGSIQHIIGNKLNGNIQRLLKLSGFCENIYTRIIFNINL